MVTYAADLQNFYVQDEKKLLPKDASVLWKVVQIRN